MRNRILVILLTLAQALPAFSEGQAPVAQPTGYDDYGKFAAGECSTPEKLPYDVCVEKYAYFKKITGGTNYNDPCNDAYKKFDEENRKFSTACGKVPSSKAGCEQQALACTMCLYKNTADAPSVCQADVPLDDLKTERERIKAATAAKMSGLNIPKPRSTRDLYRCPAYAAKEASKLKSATDKLKEELTTKEEELRQLEDELAELIKKAKDIKNESIDQIKKLTEEGKSDKKDVDEKTKKREADLVAIINNNEAAISDLTNKLAQLELDREAAKENHKNNCEAEMHRCMGEGLAIRRAKIAAGTLSVKSLGETFSNTGQNKITAMCTPAHQSCLDGKLKTISNKHFVFSTKFKADLKGIDRRADLDKEKILGAMKSLAADSQKKITELNQLDPEAAKEKAEINQKVQDAIATLQQKTNDELNSLEEQRERKEKHIAQMKAELQELRAAHTQDVAYLKTAERVSGGSIDEDAPANFKEFTAAFSSAERAANAALSLCECDGKSPRQECSNLKKFLSIGSQQNSTSPAKEAK